MRSGHLLTWAVRALVGLWALATLLAVSALMASHLLTLPEPASQALLLRQLRAEAALDGRPGTRHAVHVLAVQCRCSQRIVEQLLARGAGPSVAEKVLLIGDDGGLGGKLRARGFGVERITPEQLKARYGAESVPLLLVLGPTGRLEYVGGYSRRRQGEPQEVDILRALAAGEPVPALPLFGCAVSRQLQRQLDPLALKYPREPEPAP